MGGDAISAVADAGSAGERIDRFFAGVSGLSRSRVKGLVEDGCASVDGVVVREPAAAVRAGGVYVLTVPAAVSARPEAESIPFPILYEDSDLIVLDKPAGLVVHPAPGNEDGTLVNALLGHCGDTLPGIGGEKRPGIIHRLDKDTSGIMVVAKSEMALSVLSEAFAARDIDRAYAALVWGVPSPASGTIEGDIGRDPRERKRMAIVARGGRYARTDYRTERAWFGAVGLVECKLATGRTHQIRVHLSANRHPVVGDPVYLRRTPAAAGAVPVGVRDLLLDFPRQALHAKRLGFSHPRTGVAMGFETPVPEDFAGLVAALEGVG